MSAISLWAKDPVLGALAPVGLAAAAGTALVVDLDPAGPRYQGESSLAELVESGPRAPDLRPRRRGLAVLRNGGVSASDASEVLEALVEGWPSVVFRTCDGATPFADAPPIEVRLLLPEPLAPDLSSPGVFQRTGFRTASSVPGPLLPPLRPPVVRSLIRGIFDPRWRWIRAWRQVWEWAS